MPRDWYKHAVSLIKAGGELPFEPEDLIQVLDHWNKTAVVKQLADFASNKQCVWPRTYIT